MLVAATAAVAGVTPSTVSSRLTRLVAPSTVLPDDTSGADGTPEGTGELPEAPGRDQIESLTDAITSRIDNDILAELVERLIQPGLQIVLILLIAWAVATLAKRLIDRAVTGAKDPTDRRSRLRRRLSPGDAPVPTFSARRAQRADALGALASSIVVVVVWVMAVFLVLGEVGINLAPLVAGAGVVGLAVGFGAQDLVKDFLSGVFMLAEDQFGVGDIVDVGEATGVVEGVTLRTTRIRDIEGTLWHVPNGEIRRVGNSSQEWARSLLDISVAYGTDVDAAIEVIERVANAMAEEEGYRDQFLDAPDVWGVQALAADSVDIRLVIKTQPGKQWAISRELRRRLKAAFDAAGVEIPFPQRTLWVRNDDEREPAETTDVEGAIEHARRGDRGAERVLRQDEEVVAVDVERELAADAGAAPADRAGGGTGPDDAGRRRAGSDRDHRA